MSFDASNANLAIVTDNLGSEIINLDAEINVNCALTLDETYVSNKL